MAVDKLVDSAQLNSDLTSVANAIRTKGGTSAQLAFPAGFVSAIGDISAGDSIFATFLTNGIFDYVNKNIEISNDGSVHTYGIGYSGIRNFCVPKLNLGVRTLESCDSLINVVAKNYGQNTCYNSTHLEKADVCGTSIGNTAFKFCSSLSVLILRSDTITTITNEQVFNGTPFYSGGTGGTIYIPESLYNHLGDSSALDYKHASNWSTMEGYGTITWAKIEGSQYENNYADGTPIT